MERINNLLDALVLNALPIQTVRDEIQKVLQAQREIGRVEGLRLADESEPEEQRYNKYLLEQEEKNRRAVTALFSD